MQIHTLIAPLAGVLLAAAAAAAPQCPPDAFEPNDLCAQAAPIGVGAFAGLTITDLDFDHYRIDLPAGQRLDLTLDVQQTDPGLSGFLFLFADDGTGSPCDTFQNSLASATFGDTVAPVSLAWSAPKHAPATFYLRVQTFGAACTTYDLDVAIGPDPCAALPDDVFEPNDTCATATPLGVGTFGGLNAGIADPDHFAFTLAPKQVLTLAVSGLAAGEIATILAWDAAIACGDTNSIQNGGTIFGPTTGGTHLANTTTTPRTFVVRIVPNPNQDTGLGFCVGYSLSVTSEFDPCGAITGDAFDPNSSCFTAAPLDSTQTDLKMHAWGDQDWYSIDVPARSTLRLRSKSTQNLLVGPMLLWGSCSGSIQDFLASSHPWLFNSADPRHWLQWHNAADFGVNTRLFMKPINQGFPKPFCDTYQLEFELTLGEPFCLPTANSSGDAALLSADGSTQVGVGTLELTAAPVPAHTIGVMIFGPSNAPPMTFGGGFLCVQGPIVRLAGSGTGAQGVLATTIDWSGPASAISAGQSYSFQAWFRDPLVTPSFDLSEGLEIAFQ